MSESGLSNDEEPKTEHVQDGRWTREEHYCFLKAVAIYGREVSVKKIYRNPPNSEHRSNLKFWSLIDKTSNRRGGQAVAFVKSYSEVIWIPNAFLFLFTVETRTDRYQD